MAQTVYNPRPGGKYPRKSNRRETRTTLTGNTMVESDSDVTLTTGDGINYVLMNTTGPATVTLPPAKENLGRVITLYTETSQNISFATTDGATIAGDTSPSLNFLVTGGDWCDLFATAADWKFVRGTFS